MGEIKVADFIESTTKRPANDMANSGEFFSEKIEPKKWQKICKFYSPVSGMCTRLSPVLWHGWDFFEIQPTQNVSPDILGHNSSRIEPKLTIFSARAALGCSLSDGGRFDGLKIFLDG